MTYEHTVFYHHLGVYYLKTKGTVKQWPRISQAYFNNLSITSKGHTGDWLLLPSSVQSYYVTCLDPSMGMEKCVWLVHIRNLIHWALSVTWQILNCLLMKEWMNDSDKNSSSKYGLQVSRQAVSFGLRSVNDTCHSVFYGNKRDIYLAFLIY